MRLIKSSLHSDGSVLFDLPAGRYSHLYVRFNGTNVAGQTLAVTELGSLKLTHFNNEIVNIAPDHLVNLTNLYGGVPESSSAIGAAFTFSFVVPFRRKNDRNNALLVSPNSTRFALTGYNTAKVAAGSTIEVYGIYTNAPAAYVPVLKGVDLPIAAAMDFLYDFPVRNISQVYVVSDVNISRVQVTKDGESVVDGTFSAVDAYSDATNIVETGITFVELMAPKSDLLQEAINQQVKVKFTTTAAVNPTRCVYFAIQLPNAA
jgi:hypothetical protein